MKKAKLGKGKGKTLDDETKTRAGPRSIDGKKLLGFLKRVEAVRKTITAIMGEATKECQPHRDDIKNIVKEAAEAGFPKKEFKTMLRKRRLLDELDHIAENLDEGQKETFDLFSAALVEAPRTNGKQMKEDAQPQTSVQ